LCSIHTQRRWLPVELVYARDVWLLIQLKSDLALRHEQTQIVQVVGVISLNFRLSARDVFLSETHLCHLFFFITGQFVLDDVIVIVDLDHRVEVVLMRISRLHDISEPDQGLVVRYAAEHEYKEQ